MLVQLQCDKPAHDLTITGTTTNFVCVQWHTGSWTLEGRQPARAKLGHGGHWLMRAMPSHGRAAITGALQHTCWPPPHHNNNTLNVLVQFLMTQRAPHYCLFVHDTAHSIAYLFAWLWPWSKGALPLCFFCLFAISLSRLSTATGFRAPQTHRTQPCDENPDDSRPWQARVVMAALPLGEALIIGLNVEFG